MLRRLPVILVALAGGSALLMLGPVAVAVALLRSSSDAEGPTLAAQIFIGVLVLVLTAAGGMTGWGLGRLVQRLARGRGDGR
jgi:hypothetical protein